MEQQGYALLAVMSMVGKEEKGFNTLEVLLLTPFVLFCLFALITVGEVLVVKSVTAVAARTGARDLAIHHDVVRARDRVVQTVTRTLPADWTVSGSGASEPKKSFDPTNPNPIRPDVVLTDLGDRIQCEVTYHVPTPAPGMATLMSPSAAVMQRYLTLTSSAVFTKEEE